MVCVLPALRCARCGAGMAEADAFGLHDPVDDGAAGVAGAQAVPQVLLGADDERGLVVFVEGAEAEQVGAVSLELDAAAFGQAFERDVPFRRSITSSAMRGMRSCSPWESCQEVRYKKIRL